MTKALQLTVGQLMMKSEISEGRQRLREELLKGIREMLTDEQQKLLKIPTENE